jgi:exodeoxyribonuclease VII large subunit
METQPPGYRRQDAPGPTVQPKKVLRVAELTRYIRRLIDEDRLLTDVSVVGEVTNLSQPGSGHVYFTLKDSASQLSCAMMHTQAIRQRDELSRLRAGVNVIAEGQLTVYEPTGKYQLSVRSIQIQGAGEAKLRFERLRRQLEAEGLFAPERKRQLPAHPKCLALVTAVQSQAYHDVVKRLQAQWPRITVVVAGVTVQGDQAPGEIELALDIVNRMTDADVILIARGGGAAEELAAFNDERVARAIFASRIPVITGIGHTQDWTIADLVADAHATTPAMAAAQSVPDGQAMIRTCRLLHGQARAHVQRGLRSRRSHVAQVEQALLRVSPEYRLQVRRRRLGSVWATLLKTTTAEMQIRRRRLDAIRRQMDALNPRAVLSRGYALLTDAESGRVVASTAEATTGRVLNARVKDGAFRVTVGRRS